MVSLTRLNVTLYYIACLVCSSARLQPAEVEGSCHHIAQSVADSQSALLLVRPVLTSQRKRSASITTTKRFVSHMQIIAVSCRNHTNTQRRCEQDADFWRHIQWHTIRRRRLYTVVKSRGYTNNATRREINLEWQTHFNVSGRTGSKHQKKTDKEKTSSAVFI